MNLQKITEFYPWDDSTSKVGGEGDTLSGQFTLCLDRNSGSGEFAFVYILLNLVKRGVAVKLVVTNHSKIHYTSIFRKNVSTSSLSYRIYRSPNSISRTVQNLDISKLEQGGKLEMVQLLDESSGAGAGSYSWQELLTWQNSILAAGADSTPPTAVLFDDLDMLELLAPSPVAARSLVARFIAALSTCGATAGVLSQVVAFGRYPVETTAQLSSLGAAGSSAKGSGVVATNR